MEKAVLISIRPEWCQKIIDGEKSIEVRKTRPKLKTPFKCYIYCTNSELLTRSHFTGKTYVACHKEFKELLEKRGNITLSGKIIGEFTCDSITDWPDDSPPPIPLKNCCMTYSEIRRYGGTTETLYLWHISDLEIYDEPKPLSEFKGLCKYPDRDCCACPYYDYNIMDCKGRTLRRPPQSWCYVE